MAKPNKSRLFHLPFPLHSPHFSGLWDAGLKLAKQHLPTIIGNNILTFEEMCSFLAQIGLYVLLPIPI